MKNLEVVAMKNEDFDFGDDMDRLIDIDNNYLSL